MAWAFVNAATGAAGVGQASVSVTYPASINAGDLLVYVWAQGNTATSTTAEPSGLTQIGAEATNGNRRMRFYYKIATGSESGSITWTQDASVRQSAAILHYSGTHATPLDVAGTAATGTGVTATAPDVTTTVANDLVLRIGMVGVTSAAITSPATERVNAVDGTVALGISDANKATAGATGTADFTVTSGNWIAQTIAFKEAVAGGAKPWHYYQQQMGAA